jgi:putative acetyltransferase
MSIRPFRSSDTDGVIRVWLASTVPGQPFISEAGWRAMENEVRHELLPIADTWVVEDDGELVAFVSVIDDVIGGLFTLPTDQGKGYGSALIERARGSRELLFVEVFEANDKAVRFYRNRGFVDHERTTDEGSGLPLLILRMDG